MLDEALEQVVRFSLFLENKIMWLRFLIEREIEWEKKVFVGLV